MRISCRLGKSDILGPVDVRFEAPREGADRCLLVSAARDLQALPRTFSSRRCGPTAFFLKQRPWAFLSLSPRFFASFMAKLPDSMPVPPSLRERTWALVATSRLRGLMESLMALTTAGCFFLGWIPGPNTPLEVLLSHPLPSSIPAHSPWLVCLFPSGNVGTPCTVFFWNFLCPLSWRACPGPAVFPSVTCLSPRVLPSFSQSLLFFFFN